MTGLLISHSTFYKIEVGGLASGKLARPHYLILAILNEFSIHYYNICTLAQNTISHVHPLQICMHASNCTFWLLPQQIFTVLHS